MKKYLKHFFCILLIMLINTIASAQGTVSDSFIECNYISIENITFEFQSAYLNKKAIQELGKLTNFLKEYPKIKIEISTYSDCREANEFGKKFSNLRSKSIKDYLVKQNINRNKFSFKKYGDERYANACDCSRKCSEEEYRLNRRVEFYILKQ